MMIKPEDEQDRQSSLQRYGPSGDRFLFTALAGMEDLSDFQAALEFEVRRRQGRAASADCLTGQMTVGEFVEKKFVPEHVASKDVAGRIHYQAILKHLLRPERVDRIFAEGGKQQNGRLKSVVGWPYLDQVPLAEIDSSRARILLECATARGYSSQTVKHIRSVLGAIVAHAIRERCFQGGNPIQEVQAPAVVRCRTQTLSAKQLREVFSMMNHPEREIALVSLISGMSVAEVCGLQWRDINLTGTVSEDGRLPARSVRASRQVTSEGVREVQQGRIKATRMSPAVISILKELKSGDDGGCGSEFVFRSSPGVPISPSALREAKLRPIGRKLGIPWLTWQVLKRGRAALISDLQKEADKSVIASAYDGESKANSRYRDAGERTKEAGRAPGRETIYMLERASAAVI